MLERNTVRDSNRSSSERQSISTLLIVALSFLSETVAHKERDPRTGYDTQRQTYSLSLVLAIARTYGPRKINVYHAPRWNHVSDDVTRAPRWGAIISSCWRGTTIINAAHLGATTNVQTLSRDSVLLYALARNRNIIFVNLAHMTFNKALFQNGNVTISFVLPFT